MIATRIEDIEPMRQVTGGTVRKAVIYRDPPGNARANPASLKIPPRKASDSSGRGTGCVVDVEIRNPGEISRLSRYQPRIQRGRRDADGQVGRPATR